MPLIIVRNDITRMDVDAIVNPTNPELVPGGGTDLTIHRAAGVELMFACQNLAPLEPGHAVATPGFHLPCRYIIHTVGPVWEDGWHREETILRQCYAESLNLARECECESIAFPLIAAGALGFPRDRVLPIATETIQAFLEEADMTVYLVVYDEEAFQLSKAHFRDVQEYIDAHYLLAHPDPGNRRQEDFRRSQMIAAPREAPRHAREAAPAKRRRPSLPNLSNIFDHSKKQEDTAHRESFPKEEAVPMAPMAAPRFDPERMEVMLDESFNEMLFRKIDEKGLTDAQCYKRANIDRKHFSKIRNPQYKPGKPTVLALAIALELPLEETRELLMKAGFALSHSSKFDVIVEYYILSKDYNIYRINETLFAFDQSLLGSTG